MKKLFVIILTLSLLLVTLDQSSVYAQENQNKFAVGISPTTLQIQADNGSTPVVFISLENKNKESIELTPSFRYFKDSQTHNGEIEFINDKFLDDSERELLTKIKVLDGDNQINSITLLPYETKQLKLVIDLSATKGNGDYYFSAIFSPPIKALDTKESIITINPGVSTNILLSIGNKQKSEGSISEFKAPKFLFSGPVPITLLVENDGANLMAPEGQISITNMFGKQVSIIPIKPSIILSDSKRYLTSSNMGISDKQADRLIKNYDLPSDFLVYNDSFMFGLYTADLKLRIGNEEPFERSISFVVIPGFTIILLTAILFIIISIFIKARKKVN